jgi:hypothetical protein
MASEHKNGAAVALSEAEMVEREVDRLLAEEVAKRRAALRQEVIDRMNREKHKAHMDAIAAHCRKVDAEQEAFDRDPQRDVELAASRKAMIEKNAAADARFAESERARIEAARGREGLPRGSLQGSGAEGFAIKR